jgi:HAD superfamily hydrolase (TIGR01509 family)
MISGLRAIIFDVDGTLAETEEHHRLAFNAAFAEADLGWSWDRALYAELLRVAGGKERIRHFIETTAAASERGALIPRIAALHARKTELYTQAVLAGDIELRPGVRTLIAEAQARRFILAIATTTSRPNVEALIAATLGASAMDLFQAVVCGEDAPNKKPAPDVYIEALRRLDLPADAAVAVEDSRNGVRSARAAGLRVIATPSLYCAQDDLSDATFMAKSPAELASWLGWTNLG